MSVTMAVSSSSSAATIASEKYGKANGNDNSSPPPLSFGVVTDDQDKQTALKLVTDSIAQQRQIAAASIIFNPACIVGMVCVCGWLYRENQRNTGTMLIMVCGAVITFLAAVRLLTARYIRLAEDMRWQEWINGTGGEEDTVLAARYGDEIIAAAVLRLVPDATAAPTKKTRSSQPLKGGAGIIRAWTTKLRYRGKGIGGDLLRLSILTARSMCGSDETAVTFAPDHANSAVVLHDMFNRPFLRREEKASRALAHATRDCDEGKSSFQAP